MPTETDRAKGSWDQTHRKKIPSEEDAGSHCERQAALRGCEDEGVVVMSIITATQSSALGQPLIRTIQPPTLIV